MRGLIIFGFVLASLSCLVHSKEIKVEIKEGYNGGHNYLATFTVDDEMTVHDLAYMAHRAFQGTDQDVRLENLFMIRYDMKKTLREAGIKDGSKLVYKYWGRGEDLAANTLTRLIPL